MKANDQNSKSNTITRTEGQASMQRHIRSAHELEDKGLETRIRGLDCWNVKNTEFSKENCYVTKN